MATKNLGRIVGLSAYEVWLNQGNTGTEKDFLNSLKGKDGVDGTNGENGKDGTSGSDGADGYSPIAKVTQTENGATITITDKNGTTTANITNGKDGVGSDGPCAVTVFSDDDDATKIEKLMSAVENDNVVRPLFYRGQGADGEIAALYTLIQYLENENDLYFIFVCNFANQRFVSFALNTVTGEVTKKVSSVSWESLSKVKTLTGELENLNTEDKSNLVNAINEVGDLADSKATIEDMTNYIEEHKDELKGADGTDGINGKDGVSVTHSWNGTTLNITSASGTSSMDLKGDKGDKGDTGATGSKGEDGKTPVKGTDYWTDEDKTEIIQEVIDTLGGNPVFGVVDANNDIVLSGNLAEGEYTLKYETSDGRLIEIGTLNNVNNPEVTYTNLFDPNTATLNTRMSGSSSTSKTQDGYVMTAEISLPSSITIGSSYDDNSPYIAVPSSMWSGSANIFGKGTDGQLSAFLDAGATAGTVVGTWKKVPIHNQWSTNVMINSIIVSLYVKGSAISVSDIQNVEIYYNEIPE